MYKLFLAAFLAIIVSFAGTTCNADTPPESPAAVLHQGQRLFVYYTTLDGLKPADRARQTAEIVRELAQNPNFNPAKIVVREDPEGTSIVYEGKTIATATIDDAQLAKDTTQHLAAQFVAKLRRVLSKKVEELSAGKVVFASGFTVALALLFLMSVAVICRISAATVDRIKKWEDSLIKSVKIQEAELLSSQMVTNLMVSAAQFGQLVLIIVCFYFALLFGLDAWPATKELAEILKESTWHPVTYMFEGIVDYLPHLFVLIFIIAATQGALAFARFFFDAIEAGSIRFSGFDRDWAKPTFTLARLTIITLALVLALPFFPGWESDAFKQVGLLFGVLISLGSTQIVGHVISGTVLTYSNAFKVGDRIKIGEHVGDVVEKTVLVTRIKTPKNEIVSIPNGQVLAAEIVNYSKMASEGKLILYTQITIGYDVPWRTVRDLMIGAANDTEGVLKEPAPYVLATTLGDFTVTYEVNAHTDLAGDIPSTYSKLHQRILDKFNEAGIEIMSPRIVSLRDGNAPALPKENIPQSRKASGFLISMLKD